MTRHTLSRTLRWSSVAVTAALGMGLLLSTPSAEGAAAPTYTWKNSGFDGGGFISTIARSPKTGTIVAGGDTQGLYRSTDQGLSWSIVNQGITDSRFRRVASVLWVDDRSANGLWFAGVGSGSSNTPAGGILKSTDGGANWQMLSGSPIFEGGNATAVIGAQHPRSTGTLLASDKVFLYAGAFSSGLWRCKLSTNCDVAGEWQSLGLAGEYIRSIALDTTTNKLYAAAFRPNDASVFVVNNPGAATPVPQAAQLPSSPKGVEELATIGGRLYAVGADGVSRYTTTSPWTQLATGKWSAVDVQAVNTDDVLYLASGFLDTSRDVAQLTVARSQSTLGTPLPFEDFNENADIRGTTGRKWWLAQPGGSPPDLIGGSQYVGSQLMVDTDHTGVYLVGKAGIYRRSFAQSNWQAAVNGLNTTFVQSVALKPGMQSTVAFTDADWKYVQSVDGGTTMVRDDADGQVGFPTNGMGETGLDLAWRGDSVVVSAGNQTSNANGELFINDTPGTASSSWRPLRDSNGRSLGEVAGGCRPLSVATDGAGGAVFAAVGGGKVTSTGSPCAGGGGLYVLSNNTWVRIADPGAGAPLAMVGSGTDLAWAGGTDHNLYLWAPGATSSAASGLWRYHWIADAAAGTWTNLAPGTNDRGWIARHPTDPTIVWFATDAATSTPNTGGLRRVTGADGPSPSQNPDPGSPTAPAGPITTISGATPRLFLAVGVTSARAPALYSHALSGSTYTAISNTYYKAAGGFPTSIATTGSGAKVFVTLQGNGLIVGSS